MYEIAEPNTTKCPLCGTPLNPGALICTGCGAKKKAGSMFFQEAGVGMLVMLPLIYFFPSIGNEHIIIAGVAAGLLVKLALIKQVRWVR